MVNFTCVIQDSSSILEEFQLPFFVCVCDLDLYKTSLQLSNLL